MNPLAVTVPEAAKAIGISRSMLYVLRDRGEVEFTRIGTRVVVKVTELERFLNAQPASTSDVA